MQGTRPLDNAEIKLVSESFEGKYALRNRSLFMLGVSIGGRISELLALKVGDVYQNGKVVGDVQFSKHILKGGELSRTVPLNTDGKQAVTALVAWIDESFAVLSMADNIADEFPLFPSRKANGGMIQSITRKAADDAISAAYKAAGLNGKLGTHSMRKSFAQRLFDQTNDIFTVGQMLGHKQVTTTQKYLGVNYKSVREALEAIAIAEGTEPRDTTPLYKVSDEKLVFELMKRGYPLDGYFGD